MYIAKLSGTQFNDVFGVEKTVGRYNYLNPPSSSAIQTFALQCRSFLYRDPKHGNAPS